MSDTTSTHTAIYSDGNKDTDDRYQLERKMSQAVDEGHDADIPSSAGYVLNEEGELKRLQSIQNQKRAHPDASTERNDTDEEKGTTTATADEEDDPNIVWWDGDDDPENPNNWSTTRKFLNCGCVSFQTFISPLASCAQMKTTLTPCQ